MWHIEQRDLTWDESVKYVICTEEDEVISAHNWRPHAMLMLASPLMLEALEMLAQHRINHLEREGDDGLAREELTIIQAAIAAAKGE